MSGMKKEDWIVIAIASVAVIVLLFSFFSGSVKAPANSSYGTMTSQGTVTIEMTPEFKDGKLYMNAKFDTHAGELGDYDLTKIVALEYGGKTINPSSATKLSGHHSSSTMVFDVGKEPKSFRIVIKGMPDQPERVMEWQ